MDRLTSGRARQEIFGVLAELGPEGHAASSTEILGKLTPRAGAEMLAAVRGMHAPDFKRLLQRPPAATTRGIGGGL